MAFWKMFGCSTKPTQKAQWTTTRECRTCWDPLNFFEESESDVRLLIWPFVIGQNLFWKHCMWGTLASLLQKRNIMCRKYNFTCNLYIVYHLGSWHSSFHTKLCYICYRSRNHFMGIWTTSEYLLKHLRLFEPRVNLFMTWTYFVLHTMHILFLQGRVTILTSITATPVLLTMHHF